MLSVIASAWALLLGIALIMLLIMLSMIGIPPLAGFLAKWQVLMALVEQDMTALAIVAVVFAVVGAYYYLRIVRLMFMEAPDEESPVRPGWGVRVALAANGLVPRKISRPVRTSSAVNGLSLT